MTVLDRSAAGLRPQLGLVVGVLGWMGAWLGACAAPVVGAPASEDPLADAETKITDRGYRDLMERLRLLEALGDLSEEDRQRVQAAVEACRRGTPNPQHASCGAAQRAAPAGSRAKRLPLPRYRPGRLFTTGAFKGRLNRCVKVSAGYTWLYAMRNMLLSAWSHDAALARPASVRFKNRTYRGGLLDLTAALCTGKQATGLLFFLVDDEVRVSTDLSRMVGTDGWERPASAKPNLVFLDDDRTFGRCFRPSIATGHPFPYASAHQTTDQRQGVDPAFKRMTDPQLQAHHETFAGWVQAQLLTLHGS